MSKPNFEKYVGACGETLEAAVTSGIEKFPKPKIVKHYRVKCEKRGSEAAYYEADNLQDAIDQFCQACRTVSNDEKERIAAGRSPTITVDYKAKVVMTDEAVMVYMDFPQSLYDVLTATEVDGQKSHMATLVVRRSTDPNW